MWYVLVVLVPIVVALGWWAVYRMETPRRPRREWDCTLLAPEDDDEGW